MDPVTPTTLYAGTLRAVFRSTDGGANWTESDAGMTDPTPRFLAVDPVTPTTLYEVNYYVIPFLRDTVYRSTDGGATWTMMSEGTLVPFGLAVAPGTPTALYLAYGYGVARSVDGGANWSPIVIGLRNTVISALAVDPVTPSTLHAGAFRSTDSGFNWTYTGLYAVVGIVVDPVTPMTVYAESDSGLFKSTDGGGTFTSLHTGLTEVSYRALAVDPVTSTTVYAGTSGVVLKSTDGGANWIVLGPAFVQALAIDPVTPATIYAGTYSGDGVYKSRPCHHLPGLGSRHPNDVVCRNRRWHLQEHRRGCELEPARRGPDRARERLGGRPGHTGDHLCGNR
jgi:hypothetical protein